MKYPVDAYRIFVDIFVWVPIEDFGMYPIFPYVANEPIPMHEVDVDLLVYLCKQKKIPCDHLFHIFSAYTTTGLYYGNLHK